MIKANFMILILNFLLCSVSYATFTFDASRMNVEDGNSSELTGKVITVSKVKLKFKRDPVFEFGDAEIEIYDGVSWYETILVNALVFKEYGLTIDDFVRLIKDSINSESFDFTLTPTRAGRRGHQSNGMLFFIEIESPKLQIGN